MTSSILQLNLILPGTYFGYCILSLLPHLLERATPYLRYSSAISTNEVTNVGLTSDSLQPERFFCHSLNKPVWLFSTSSKLCRVAKAFVTESTINEIKIPSWNGCCSDTKFPNSSLIHDVFNCQINDLTCRCMKRPVYRPALTVALDRDVK